jgi:hypothetical protein
MVVRGVNSKAHAVTSLRVLVQIHVLPKQRIRCLTLNLSMAVQLIWIDDLVHALPSDWPFRQLRRIFRCCETHHVVIYRIWKVSVRLC